MTLRSVPYSKSVRLCSSASLSASQDSVTTAMSNSSSSKHSRSELTLGESERAFEFNSLITNHIELIKLLAYCEKRANR